MYNRALIMRVQVLQSVGNSKNLKDTLKCAKRERIVQHTNGQGSTVGFCT